MGNKRSKIIDSIIDKKLISSFRDVYSKISLFEFVTNKTTQDAYKVVKIIGSSSTVNSEQDLYGNQKFKFLNAANSNPSGGFNILKMFKPGEILQFVSDK